jgi:CheY-like chemotaxis protein
MLMATKVLVFESDPAFAGELRSEFGKLGCSTIVVDDGNLGLQRAAAERPDLILLSIELPRMNGFSVCNKLKKDSNLKDVPLIIMSSESSDETFEQHKKLRTRAEDYVHKPIAFGELLQHVQVFVPLAPFAQESDSAIVIDDEIELGSEIEIGTVDYVADDVGGEAQEGVAAQPVAEARISTVDADVDAFAESAFGRLTEPGTPAVDAHGQARGLPNGAPAMEPASSVAVVNLVKAASMTARAPSLRPPPAAPMGVDPAEYERVRDELVRVKERFDQVDHAFEDTRAELERLRLEAADGERRGREVEELKAKLAAHPKGAAVSSREFLDLREALNRKDKEILSFKEQISKKDKQIVEAQDRALVAERGHADLDERLLSLEREIDETKEKNESLAADRDLAKKASEDFRARLDKLRAEAEANDRQQADARSRHVEEIAVAEEKFAAMRAELDQILANERAEHARALDQSEQRRKADLDQAQRDHDAQLASARDEWHQELELVRAEAEQHEQASVDRVRMELQAIAARDIGEATSKAERLAQELASARDEAASLQKTNGELESKLAVGQAHAASIEADLATVRKDLDDAKQRLAIESARADGAHAKWQADRQSLERAKDALAIALAQIEEAEERPIS